MRVAALLSCLCALLAPPTATATAIAVERFESVDAAAGIADVRAAQQGWIATEPALRRAGGSPWWRLTVAAAEAGSRPAADADLIVSLREAYDARLVAYLPPDYAPRALHTYDPGLRQIGSRHRLTLRLPASLAAQPVYIRVDQARDQPIGVQVQPLADYVADDVARVRFTSAMLAALVLLASVGAIYAFALRRHILLLFCLWIVSIMIYMAVLSGEITWLLGTWLPWLKPMQLSALAVNIGVLAAYAFVHGFLGLRESFPRLSRLYRGLLWVLVALMAVMLAVGESPRLSSIQNLLVLALAPLALGMAAHLARLGAAQAWFFLLGWGAVVLVGTLRAWHFLHAQGTPVWLEYAHPAINAFGALVLVLATARAARYAEREMHSARASARTDPLTGLPNRSWLDSELPRLVARAHAQRRPLALLFIDLDHFKRINDTWGHDLGDLCLQTMAAALRRHVRATDLVARYGGEEFVLVLENADAEAAARVAAALLDSVRQHGLEVAGRPTGMTVSIGLAALAGGERAADLLRRADTALYQAKRAGRNRTCMADGAAAGDRAPGRRPLGALP